MIEKIENILFLCLGNICRSPFAEGLFKKQLSENRLKGFRADSAGLMALPGNSATYLAQRVALEHQVDLSQHEAKPVSKALVDWSDLILVMEKHQKDSLGDRFQKVAEKTLLIRNFARFGSKDRGIADPYGLEYNAYRFCFLDIEDAVSGLIEYLGNR